MSPMIASTSDIRPPAPSPWNARNQASSVIDVANEQAAEPTTKMPMAVRKYGLRPCRSDSLPYSGVVIVEVIRYAVVAHACWLRPCRSSEIVRIAVLTIVWSRAARNMPSSRPLRMVRICRWVSPPGGDDGAASSGTAAVSVIPPQ